MSNLISFHYGNVPDLVMNNGLTAVFIDTLCITGGIIAASEAEKEILVRLAGQDASIFGDGFTGFEIGELFEGLDNRIVSEFLMRVAASALSGVGFEKLPYAPDTSLLSAAVNQFSSMLVSYGSSEMRNPSEWSGLAGSTYVKCPIHGIYLHSLGCVVCNNQ